jgi:hypothetical protein
MAAAGQTHKREGDPIHPQPTLGDYNAWILQRLAEERGEKVSTVAGWIIDRWIEQNKDLLEDEYRIVRDDYRAAKGLTHQPHAG